MQLTFTSNNEIRVCIEPFEFRLINGASLICKAGQEILIKGADRTGNVFFKTKNHGTDIESICFATADIIFANTAPK